MIYFLSDIIILQEENRMCFGVPADYSGEIPEGFEYRDFPE